MPSAPETRFLTVNKEWSWMRVCTAISAPGLTLRWSSWLRWAISLSLHSVVFCPSISWYSSWAFKHNKSWVWAPSQIQESSRTGWHLFIYYEDTNLTVFGGDGLCETLNGSFLTLSSLTDWTQLTPHLIQLLLQLLQMEISITHQSSDMDLSNISNLNEAF